MQTAYYANVNVFRVA